MLELKNISFCVEDKAILEDINLGFEDGKIYAITGHNGSGKSTLLKIIMGILRQTSGSVILDGEAIDQLSVDERSKRGIAFAFQQPVRFKGLLVSDLINIAQNKKTGPGCGCDYLSQVGLCAKDYYSREVDSSLSGGELKRIELAIQLAQNKQINIFDEPEAGVDIWSFDGLVEIFRNLKKRGAMTIIVTHQQKILEIADEIIVLNSSKIESKGQASDVLKMLKSSTCKKLELEGENGKN